MFSRRGLVVIIMWVGVLVFSPILAGGQNRDKAEDLRSLIAILQGGKDTSERIEAAKKLGYSHSPEALAPLMEALKEENRAVCWAALEALGRLGDKRALSTILEYLRKDEPYCWGKILAIGALGKLKDPGAVEPLLNYLKEKDPYVRRAVLFALGKIGDDKAIPKLIPLFKDNNPVVSRHLQEVLVELAKAKVGGNGPKDYDSWLKWYEARNRQPGATSSPPKR